MSDFLAWALIVLTTTALFKQVYGYPALQPNLLRPPVTPPLPDLTPLAADDVEYTLADNEERPTTSSLGIHYGECYYIKDVNSGKTRGSDGGVYSYYKFGSARRTFQAWNTRSFPNPADAGSTQTNGGSWVATKLGGYTYPGFGGYWYYLHFKGYRTHKRPHGGTAVTLGLAQVEPPSPLPNYRGLKVSRDYIWNEDNEDTIDVIFVSTGCHDDDNDAVDV
ncbi:uncharacterized protein BO88DRAFT_412040 [Aspergillus vadensis CBS 113365]|uniref:Uncharacterized protein n=1 Tax=Aspergillus vadensis (strain CBS 113365 / IMI 142717 / IBT 24658) TaxID=1448311 RepID=A0A319BPR5_ASPVC|nr:hypothetical protein BO88DRAFT_412040 [Aspergillus vadensis CBS 113365]PYH73160.1 hypothetical protein BO88DRAFT_412040 [Aspergillus vadensis CBS 113365]